jgi:hypothetical protein
LRNENGQVNKIASIDYDAFGNVVSGQNPINIAYTGKYHDETTNLQWNMAIRAGKVNRNVQEAAWQEPETANPEAMRPLNNSKMQLPYWIPNWLRWFFIGL